MHLRKIATLPLVGGMSSVACCRSVVVVVAPNQSKQENEGIKEDQSSQKKERARPCLIAVGEVTHDEAEGAFSARDLSNFPSFDGPPFFDGDSLLHADYHK